MARINLLPWRAERRKQRQREFGFMAVGGLVISLLIAGYSHIHIQGLIDNQNKRNKFLQDEIAILDQKIVEIRQLEKKKRDLLARMNIIQKLQASRPQIVHLFDEIATTTPDGVYLNGLKQAGNKVDIAGRAQSNARVSAYMRRIDASDWVGKSRLIYIQESKNRQATDDYSTFELSMLQQTKKDDEQGE